MGVCLPHSISAHPPTLACALHTPLLTNLPSQLKIMSKIGQIHSAPSPQDHTHPSSTSIAIPRDIESSSSSAAAVDYKARAQWLRAAVLGANDGLVSVSSLILGVAAANPAPKATLISGLAGLVAGACSMAIGEYVSVSTQLDIETNQDPDAPKESLPRPMQAAAASACAFAAGAALPLAAGGFIRPWGVRVGAVCAVSSLGLAGFGAAGAALGGGARVGRSGVRVLVGGWMAMLVTYGVVRLFGVLFNMQVSAAST